MTELEAMQYCREHIKDIDASRRGGTIKVDVSELFDVEDEDAIIGAYQNYLGGGMLGAVQFGSMFAPTEEQAELFATFKEAVKKVFHEITNTEAGEWDEWAESSYEQNQARAVSGY